MWTNSRRRDAGPGMPLEARAVVPGWPTRGGTTCRTGRCLLIGVAATVICAGGARADVQVFRLVNDAHVSAGLIQRLERSLTAYGETVAKRWSTPVAMFSDSSQSAWPIALMTPQTYAETPCPPDSGGCHDVESGGPQAWVSWSATDGSPDTANAIVDELMLSHEFAETLVDPLLEGEEICDAVDSAYTIDHADVILSDFVLPSWFSGSAGPFDYLGAIKASGQQLGPYATWWPYPSAPRPRTRHPYFRSHRPQPRRPRRRGR